MLSVSQEHVSFRLPSSEAAGLAGMQLQLLKLPGHPVHEAAGLNSSHDSVTESSEILIPFSHPPLNETVSQNLQGRSKLLSKQGGGNGSCRRRSQASPRGPRRRGTGDAEVAAAAREGCSSPRTSGARGRWLSPASPGHPEEPRQSPEPEDHTSAVESGAAPRHERLSASEVRFFSKQEPNSWNSPKTMGKYDFLLRFWILFQ